MTKPTYEWRVVCAHYGTGPRHEQCKWTKHGKDAKHKAKQSVIDLNHASDMRPDNNFYKDEAPYRVQSREVSGWVDDE